MAMGDTASNFNMGYKMKVLVKDSEFLAYLAGVIDSDGSIGISKRTEKMNTHGYSYRETVQLTWKYDNATLKFVNMLKNIYGGSTGIYSGGFNNKTETVRYSADGKGAERIAKDILPYLILKKKQAELVLEMRLIKNVKYGNGNKKPEFVWLAEEAIYQKALIQRKVRG